MKVSDESPAISAPLLPPPPPPPPPSIAAETLSFVHHPRPLRDLPFLLLFLLLSLSSFIIGVLSISRHNPHHSASSCSPPPLQSLLLRSSSKSSIFNKHLIFTLIITAAAAPLLALALLSLLRRFPRHLVYLSLPFFILIPSLLNLYRFLSCSLSNPSCSRAFPLPYRILLLVFIFLLIALLLYVLISNAHRIDLTVKILRVAAAAALEENLVLFAVLPAMGVGVAVYLVPFVVFLVFARWNGVVERREGGECVWREERWVPAYYALAIVTMVWSVATVVEARGGFTMGAVGALAPTGILGKNEWYICIRFERGI